MQGSRDLVIGTAGHIDHGKTALVRALTGVDTDRLPAEKRRGITIDLGFASLEVGGHRLALVDVPGHERFVRNMLAGASGLDLALLIVAADDSVMPQTLEHLEILQILGLSGGVTVLTKCDLVDASWLDLVEDEVRALVSGTFLESAEIVRTSAPSGLGIEDLKASLGRLCNAVPDREDVGLFRLAIDRAFTVAGHGTIVTGTVASGEVAVGDDLEWFPGGRKVRVRGLHRHDRPVESVGRGARAAINLVGVHHSEIERGQILASPGYLEPSKIVAVEVQTSRDAVRPLRHRKRYRVHLGTAEVSASLALLEANELGPTARGLAQLFLAEPVAVVHGQPFVIREESPAATLGGGRVLRPVGRRRIRRKDEGEIDRLSRLTSPETATRIAAALSSAGLAGWTDRTLTRDAGVAIDRLGPPIEALADAGALMDLPVGPKRTLRLPTEVVAGLEERLLKTLARLHRESPRTSAIARARVASSLADLENDPLVSAVIDRLRASGRVVAEARTVALTGHEPKLSQAERKLKKEMAEAYRLAACAPPEVSAWSNQDRTRDATVAGLIALLVEEGQIIEFGPGLYLDHGAEAEMRRKVAGRLAGGSGMTMADLRDLLGTTRKYAIPIGEYLDRIGWTRREGDIRTLGDGAEVAGRIEEGIAP